MTRSTPFTTGQDDGSSVGLDLRRPDRPARGRGASRYFIASGPAHSSPPRVAALACGGRCVCAGRRDSQSAAVISDPKTVGAGPAVAKYRRRATPFQSDALREGSEVLPCVVALHDRENDGSHHCDGGKVCREVGNVCRD